MSSSDRSNQNEYRDDVDDDEDLVSNQVLSEDSEISVSDSQSQKSDDFEELASNKRKLKPGKKKLMKKEVPRKKAKINPLFEEEAEEASDDENSEPDYDQLKNRPEIKEKEFDRKFKEVIEKRSKKQNFIQNFEEKYKDLGEGEARELLDADGLESNDEDVEPPGINDPKIWRVGCKRGKENEAAMSLMFKYANFKNYDQTLEIVSAFALKKYPGTIFVEAYFDWQVQKAIEGIFNLRQTGVEIVEEQNCISLFSPNEQEPIPLELGQWVRVKSHQIYENDLARVLDIDEQRRTVRLKLIPREKRELASFTSVEQQATNSKSKVKVQASQFTMKGEHEEEEKANDQKPSKWFYRTKYLIDQKRFVKGPKIPIKYERNATSNDENNSIFYYNDIQIEKHRCKMDGFTQITTSVTNVIWKNVKPTLEELAYFYPDLKNIVAILPKIQKSLKASTAPKFQIGEKVQLIAKDAPQITFNVKEILPDGKLLLTRSVKNKDTNQITVYENQVDPTEVKIAFQNYQQVNVVSGPNAGLQGVIINLKKNEAIISTDNNQIIECLLTDLQTHKKIQGYDQSINADPYKAQMLSQKTEDLTKQKQSAPGGLSRNDLIKFGSLDMDIGCVLSITQNNITVVDLNNKIRNINQMQVSSKINTRNNVTRNLHRQEIRKGDMIIILDGFYKSQKATVIHVYRDCIFLHSGKFELTQGIIVEKATNVALISSASAGQQPNMNAQRNKQNESNPVQDLLGKTLTIAKGQWAGYRGLVTSVQAKTVTVQLTAKNLNVKVLKEDLTPGGSTQINTQTAKTPHYAPQQSIRVWGDDDNQQRATMQGYQSPYVYGQPSQYDYN